MLSNDSGRPLRRRLVFAAGTVLFVLAAVEGTLRLAGLPTGKWRLPDGRSVYPRSRRLVATWGPIRYVLTTNALGLRGDEVAPAKPAGTRRVLAIGDSATDGFFVDDVDTFPSQLGRLLRRRGHQVEVVNGAVGGGSIDHERAMLEMLAPVLAPDIVLLTFSTNDVAEIEAVPLDRLLHPDRPAGPRRFELRYTAIGEAMLSVYVGLSAYAPPTLHASARREVGDPRYIVAGGAEFERNARIFFERYRSTDGLIVGRARFEPDVEAAVQRYLQALDALAALTRTQGATLALAYLPAYPEIYLDLRGTMRDRLREQAAASGIPFVDLTPSLRRAARGTVLHIAPVDFHLNPDGYAVVAAALASFLEQSELFPLRREHEREGEIQELRRVQTRSAAATARPAKISRNPHE